MRQLLSRFCLVWLVAALFTQSGLAQDQSLADMARKIRERKAARDAADAANFKLGVTPRVAEPGEVIPAHFLIIRGRAGMGEFGVRINGEMIFHNSYVHDLPIYVSPVLLEGNNLLEVLFISGDTPLDVTVEERTRSSSHLLAEFHARAHENSSPVVKSVQFTAHPATPPPIIITAVDRAAINKVVGDFYRSLATKDGSQVFSLFAPAIQDTQKIYPEGAAFGQEQLKKMAALIATNGFAMRPFDATGLELKPGNGMVIVQRTDDKPVFTSNDVTLANGSVTNVKAETVPVKKVNGEWQLALPLGF